MIKSKLVKINNQVKELHNINILEMTDANYKEFIEKINSGYDDKYGGRGLITTLETEYVDKLAEFIFDKNLFGTNKTEKGKIINIEVTMKATEIVFTIV